MSGPLTEAGEAAVAELAARYRVSDGAVRALLEAVIRGGGSMAQFSHPDLGGSGQWMRGGMTMVGDMFNPGLQSTVSGICSDLAGRLASGQALVAAPVRTAGGASYDAFGTVGGDWWPQDLGRPSSSGGQNDAAYAYFPGPRRLAIRRGDTITVFDTADHAISGVQQQQGTRGSLEFSSQLGTFTVDSLQEVAQDGATAGQRVGRPATPEPGGAGAPPAAMPEHRPPPPSSAPPAAPAGPPAAAQPPPVPPAPAPVPSPARSAGGASTPAEIGSAIETLAGLRDKGFLTDEEFAAKKTELLARL